MLTDRIESGWISAFARVFDLCAIRRGETVVILSESQSRPLNVHLAELALGQLGLQWAEIRVPTPVHPAGPVMRSTGGSQALNGQDWAVGALAGRQAFEPRLVLAEHRVDIDHEAAEIVMAVAHRLPDVELG